MRNLQPMNNGFNPGMLGQQHMRSPYYAGHGTYSPGDGYHGGHGAYVPGVEYHHGGGTYIH